MAVDISAQLRAIANDEYGETVLSNIGSAAEVLNESAQTDISSELATIYNGVYGRNIRRAIYDALFKLSLSSSGGGSPSYIMGSPILLVTEAMFGSPGLFGTPVIEEE